MKRYLVLTACLVIGGTAHSQGNTAVGLRFVRWTEPKERSFSLEIPSGWSVESGVNWLSQIDPQRFIRLQSPNKKITIFFGDPELLARQVPTAAGRMQAGGAREGQVFRLPSGGPAMLQRFMTGEEYAKAHTAWRMCQNPTWVLSREDREMSRAMADAVAPEARRFNLVPDVRSGEVTFTCGNMQGATQATTILVGSGQIQMWMVYRVGGFISSDPLQSMQARYVMERLAATFQDDARWIAALERRTMEVAGAVMNMQNAATQAALAASRQQNETLSRLNNPNTYSPSSRARSGRASSAGGRDVNTTLGTARVCDAIGRCSTVSTTSDSHYMDHAGNVRAGTKAGAPPDNTGVWSRLY